MDLKRNKTRNVFDFRYILGILERLIPPTPICPSACPCLQPVNACIPVSSHPARAHRSQVYVQTFWCVRWKRKGTKLMVSECL